MIPYITVYNGYKELVHVVSWDREGFYQVIDRYGKLRNESTFSIETRFSNRWFRLPKYLSFPIPTKKETREEIRSWNVTGHRFTVSTRGKTYRARSLKTAFKLIKKHRDSFTSLKLISLYGEVIIDSSGVLEKSSLSKRALKNVSLKTLRREWARIEKKRN